MPKQTTAPSSEPRLHSTEFTNEELEAMDENTLITNIIRKACEEEKLGVSHQPYRTPFMAGVGLLLGYFAGGTWGSVLGAVLGAAIAMKTADAPTPLWQEITKWPYFVRRQLIDNVYIVVHEEATSYDNASDARTIPALLYIKGRSVKTIINFCQNVQKLKIVRIK